MHVLLQDPAVYCSNSSACATSELPAPGCQLQPRGSHGDASCLHSSCCSFYIVTYALGIYNLNLLLGFLRCGWLNLAQRQLASCAGADAALALRADEGPCYAGRPLRTETCAAFATLALPRHTPARLALRSCPPALPVMQAAHAPIRSPFPLAVGLPHSRLPPRAPPCSPQVNPELEGPTLPSKADEEFRPFVRRLPEFKFWCAPARCGAQIAPDCNRPAACSAGVAKLSGSCARPSILGRVVGWQHQDAGRADQKALLTARLRTVAARLAASRGIFCCGDPPSSLPRHSPPCSRLLAQVEQPQGAAHWLHSHLLPHV